MASLSSCCGWQGHDVAGDSNDNDESHSGFVMLFAIGTAPVFGSWAGWFATSPVIQDLPGRRHHCCRCT